MKMLICGLVFCIVHAMLVTGENLLLLTYDKNLYSHNTVTKKTKKIAEKVETMACYYDRQLIYYSILPGREGIVHIGRMNQYGGDMKIIFDKGDDTTFNIGIDQETGNIYYNSEEGIGFLSYTRNYSNTVLSTTPESRRTVYDFGFHGKGTNKSVYWSIWTNLYKLQPGTSKPIALGVRCHNFIILNQEMVCLNIRSGLYLANMDGVKTESLPNIAITSAKLTNFDCVGSVGREDITMAKGIIYILCSKPNRLFKLSVTNNAVRGLVLEQQPGLPHGEWYEVCVWHQEKSVVVMSPQTGTIVTVVGIVAGIFLLVTIQAILIIKCVKHKQTKATDPNPNEILENTTANDKRPQESVSNIYSTL